jgi:DNA polymerase elongation subunit (family B)
VVSTSDEDSDSIVVEAKGEVEETCTYRGNTENVKRVERLEETMFKTLYADLNERILIVPTSKKKYNTILRTGEDETRGTAPVRRTRT